MKSDRFKIVKYHSALIALIGVPVFFAFLAITTRNLQGPYYLAFNFDPSYAYLMNSLNIACGERPGHIHHPGISVQLLGGCILKISSVINRLHSGPKDICLEVLENPEKYLLMISNFLIFLVGVTVFLFGWTIYFYTKRLFLAIVTQAFPLSFPPIIDHLTRVEPEPLLTATAYSLAALMVPVITNTDFNLGNSRRTTILFGIIIGFGVVSKISFLPFILLVLVFRGYRARFIALTAFLLTIILLTIPIWDKTADIFDWIVRLTTHSGKYGKGDFGLPTPIQLFHTAKSLFGLVPDLFYLIPLLFAAIIINLKYTLSAGLKRLLPVLTIVLICHLAINVKHPSPAGHYLIPIMAFSGFLIFSIVLSLSKWNTKLLVGVITIVSIINVFTAAGNLKRVLLKYQSKHKNFSIIQEVATKNYGCSIVSYYRSSSPKYALMFGDGYARNAHKHYLMQIYPDYISYNIWGQFYSGFQGHYSKNKIPPLLKQSTNPVCLVGTVTLPYNGQPKVVELETEGDVKLYQFLGFNKEDSIE
jgi:hypothetical protein